MHPATRLLEQAWRDGRPIVPFLGAGISIAAGFPGVGALCEYFAKVKFYIEEGVFNYSRGHKTGLRKKLNPYRENPSKYLGDYGWPDYYQINTELWNYISDYTAEAVERTSHASESGDNRSEMAWIDDAYRHVFISDFEAYIRYTTSHQGIRWGKGPWKIQTLIQFEFLRMLAEEDVKIAQEIQTSVWDLGDLRLRGNWASLLMNLTEGKVDFIDSLFSTLAVGRQPALSHIYLTHLCRLFGCRLLVSTNFDKLLEVSMRQENLNPEIFDVFRDASLPTATLVHRQLSVLKVHGSANGLRTGERLDYALDTDTRVRALEIIPDDALILVLGFSGRERRMLQLVEAAVTRHSGDSDIKRCTPSVIWLHYEPISTKEIPYQMRGDRYTRSLGALSRCWQS
jgi:hypothetical protein